MKEAYFKYWGKAEKDGPGFHLLPYHCPDVAAVGYLEGLWHDIGKYSEGLLL